jgi:hypothetical protein
LTESHVHHLYRGEVPLIEEPDNSEQLGKAMIRSSRRDRSVKAFAEVLAMIASAQHPPTLHGPLPAHETDDWLSEAATKFCAALDAYAKHAMHKKRIH